jgi:hypothetical protein
LITKFINVQSISSTTIFRRIASTKHIATGQSFGGKYGGILDRVAAA